jgi:hypothetical protein
VIAYYFGLCSELDIEPDWMGIGMRVPVRATQLHLSQMRTLSTLPFVAMLERLDIPYHYEMVPSVNEDGFLEFNYTVQVQPRTENPDHTAFLIRIESGRYPLPKTWRDLLREGGMKRLFAFDPAAFP